MKHAILITLAVIAVTGSCRVVVAATPSHQQLGATAPMTQSGSYRVTIESVHRKANNFTVTMIFENLSDSTLRLRWGGGKNDETDGPYLIDENSQKYLLQEIDSDHVVDQGSDLLAKTKLKSRFLFYGPGQGSAFSFVATETRPRNAQVTIKGVKVTSSEQSPVTSNLPTLVTESYRVVVTDVRKEPENIILTLIFENLLDKSFHLIWGCGSRHEENWQSAEPYLIDENADRYYLRKRDDAKVVGNEGWGRCWGPEAPEILPRTKLKTRFTFKISGTGTTFTLGAKEHSPGNDRAIVIRDLKVTSDQSSAIPLLRDPEEATKKSTALCTDAARDLSNGTNAYNNGRYSESFDYFSRAILCGQQLTVSVKHHHKGSLGLGNDLCAGKLIFTKDWLEFQSLSTQTEGERRSLLSHFFRVSYADIIALKLDPNTQSRIRLKISVSKGNKQEQSEWGLYPSRARMEGGRSPQLRCLDCWGKSEVIAKLISKLSEGEK